MPPITFTNDYFKAIDLDHEDPMVVANDVPNFVVMKTLVDHYSSVNILYWKTLKHLGLS